MKKIGFSILVIVFLNSSAFALTLEYVKIEATRSSGKWIARGIKRGEIVVSPNKKLVPVTAEVPIQQDIQPIPKRSSTTWSVSVYSLDLGQEKPNTTDKPTMELTVGCDTFWYLG